MAIESKRVRFKNDMAALEAGRKDPTKALKPHEIIHIRRRCKLCGRPRAVYQKFGICRICFRKLADQGLIPGVRNASW